MRLHRLEMTAFGPFADTVSVDFDELGSAGLFLLTGATGAGKSSVLDGVCFALYGDVPGDRATAKRLRSDQAPPERAPRVSLEVTLAGRRFRIDRSPAWQRPKKRGTGTTSQQATVAIAELVDGDWTTWSTRLDETGHLVTSLVGMTLPQFCQVAMLPQGRFQAFLRARSEERHALLARVFQTGRFEEVERWLRERRTTTRKAAEAQASVVADLLSRVSETAGEPAPEDPGDDLGDDLGAWSAGHLATASEVASAAGRRLDEARVAEASARASHETGTTLARRRRAHAEALAELARLDDLTPAHEERVARLRGARRAAPVAPLLRLAAHAAHEADRSLASALPAVAAAGTDPAADDPDTLLFARQADLTQRIVRVRAALPRESELARTQHAVQTAATAVRRAEGELAGIDEERSALPGRLAQAREDLAGAAHARSAVDSARADLDRAEGRLAAVLRQVELEPVVADARHRRDGARTLLADAREAWLAVREARLEGMAAELASGLAAGCSCPVCGSAEHPLPARSPSGAPDAAAEKAARRSVDDVEADLHLCEEELRGVETELALVRQRIGEDVSPDRAREERESAALRLSELRDRAATHDAHERVVAEHERRLASLDEAAAAAAQQRDLQVARRDEASRAAVSLQAELDDLLDDTGHDSLDGLLAELERARRVVTTATDALADHLRTSEEHARTARAARDAAVEAGFGSTAAAGGAVLDDAALAALEQEVTVHRERRTRAEELLRDPDLVEAATSSAPDLAALRDALAEAEAELAAAGRDHAVAERCHERLTHLHRDLLAALRAWAPLRAEHALAGEVAALADGSSPDNTLRMRLSAYVLAHRLGQVVDAANERLGSMSDQRYSLEHTGRRGAGETRGGLSLLVRDDWSGESRAPATLSGGETFVVSLALALGLADVIAHEAGGAELDTLFVDEGFGSLDADTLDHVMDTLDALRDGGRVVGVVSHVSEMRDRIPAQLEVATGRHGSSVALRTG